MVPLLQGRVHRHSKHPLFCCLDPATQFPQFTYTSLLGTTSLLKGQEKKKNFFKLSDRFAFLQNPEPTRAQAVNSAQQGPRLGSEPTSSHPESRALIPKCLPQRDSCLWFSEGKAPQLLGNCAPHPEGSILTLESIPCPPSPAVEYIPHLGLSGRVPVRRATMSIDVPMCLDNWEGKGLFRVGPSGVS